MQLGSCGTDVTINALVLFYVTMSSDSQSPVSEHDGPAKEPVGPNVSSPSAAVQSFAMRSHSGKPTVIVGRGGPRGALAPPRNDYSYFPEPVEPLDPTKLGTTEVSPEDGGAHPLSSSPLSLQSVRSTAG